MDARDRMKIDEEGGIFLEYFYQDSLWAR